GEMKISLGIYAGVIFALYSIYFAKIIKGKPEEFELDMMKSLANWMIATGVKSQAQIWLMLGSSLILEAAYFYLVLTIISNTFLLYFTWLFIGIEIVHILSLFIAFYLFFHTRLLLKDIFKWRLERTSALLFFTHSLLLIINLIYS
ncbi:MAG: hypothetical protein PHC92_11415, partial [Syntrophomonadaceae bacterium]|nr:hypothetical protein [Syntrophomonadaceae bacterium]